MKARREKNLCYNYDEVYSPEYRCKQKHIHMMITEEEESIYEAEVGSNEHQNKEVLKEDITLSLK